MPRRRGGGGFGRCGGRGLGGGYGSMGVQVENVSVLTVVIGNLINEVFLVMR